MGLITLIYSILLLWAIIHLGHRFGTRRGDQYSSTVLPSTSSRRAPKRAWFSIPSLKVTLQSVYLRLETTGFNDLHDSFTLYLNKRSRGYLKRMVTSFYNCGSIAGVVGMLAALGLLAVTAYSSLYSLLSRLITASNVDHLQPSGNLYKRDGPTLDISAEKIQPSLNPPLQIILPGVTVPLSHLPLLLIALFFSQAIHELGHAVTAALESVPIASIGASLSVIIPSAFVALPSAPVQALSPHAKLRIISAGSFHNLILWIILLFFHWVGLGQTIWSVLGYEDVGHFGRVVVAVDQASPLRDFLPVRSIITALDDQNVGSSNILSSDIWYTYLSQSSRDHKLGWCVDKPWFLERSQDCCDALHHAPTETTCFSAEDPSSIPSTLQRCLPPLSVLQPDAPSTKRCTEAAHCGTNHLCVKLGEDTELLRIQFRTPDPKNGNPRDPIIKTVVWSGPPSELLEEVEVSEYRPRFSFIPAGLPNMITILFKYVSTLTLSLYFFNLLPLPYLDGSQLLEALLNLIPDPLAPSFRVGSVDLESAFDNLRSQRPQHIQGRAQVQRGIQLLSSILIATSLVLSVLTAVQ